MNFARRAIDLGANVYWWNSNHMPQGIEIYKGKPMLYDCRDFIDDYAVDRQHRNDLSFFRLNCGTQGMGGIELIPTMIHDFHTNTILSTKADLIVGMMVERCNRLGTKCIVYKGRVSIPVFRQ